MKKSLNILSVIFVTTIIILFACPNIPSWMGNIIDKYKYNSSCSVSNNSDFEVNLRRFSYHNSYSDKFMSVYEYGEGYGDVAVSGPQISPYRDGSLDIEVSLDILDKKSRTKIDSRRIRVNVRDHKSSSESSGEEQIVFYGLKPGEYVVRINEARCLY